MAELMNRILGHEDNKRVLLSLTAKKKFFSGVIFSGPEGVGKKLMAMACLQELNCEQPKACGQCRHCVDIEKQSAIYLELIEPQGGKIKIEQVREMIDKISLQSWVSHRFVVIDGIEKIHVAAANALLKSLEEPPPSVHFVLLTSSLSQVLPTLRSRCQVVSFEALKEHELSQLCPGLQDWQKPWSLGRISLAQKIQDPDWQEVRTEALNYLQNWQEPTVQKKIVESLGDPEKADFVTHCWLTLLRDAQLFQAGRRQGFYNGADLALIELFARRGNLVPLYDKMMEARQDVAGNVDKNLIMDLMSMELDTNAQNH